MTEAPQISAHLSGMVNDALRRHRIADDDWLAGAHDAGFLQADAFAVIAQKFHVVKVNAGNDGAIGVQDVDGIQPPAQTDFQNHHVKLGVGQQLQDGQGGEFKVSQ